MDLATKGCKKKVSPLFGQAHTFLVQRGKQSNTLLDGNHVGDYLWKDLQWKACELMQIARRINYRNRSDVCFWLYPGLGQPPVVVIGRIF